MSDSPDLAARLSALYAHHRCELVKASGVRQLPNVDRLMSLFAPHAEAMAAVIADWQVSPETVMAAAFEMAKMNRHPNGPMPNMLKSAKYLTKAISEYLQIPYEAVVEKKSAKVFLDRLDFELSKYRDHLTARGITDLVSTTSYPLEIRFILALERMDREAMFLMSDELLRLMTEDRRVTTWLNHRGVTYEKLAALFNAEKKRRQNRPAK